MVEYPVPAKAVVTGASGFIGQALTAALAARGCEVLAVDRHSCPLPGCRSLQADVATPQLLQPHLDQHTVVFHLAARADVAASVADPRQDYANTFLPLFEVLEAARATGARVIFPSTASVFDPGNPLPLDENAPKKPTSPYGAAKLAGEGYVFAYHRSYGVDARVARLFSVYGVGMYRFAIHDLVRKIQRNPDRLELLGDGTQIRDYLYVDDAVSGLVAVAMAGRAGEDYNVASGEEVSIDDLARRIAAAMGHPDAQIVPTGRSFPGDTPRWFADIRKARALGWAPRVGLDEGLTRTIAWLTAR